MKYFIILVIVCFVGVIFADDEKYTSKFDNFDFKPILENDRLLTNYINCIIGTGKCTPQGEELKKYALDALETCCGKCTDKQKEGFKTAYKYLSKNKPHIVTDLKERFDPKGEHEEKCKSTFNLEEDK